MSGKGGKWGEGRVFCYEDDSTSPPSKFDVARGAGASNRLLAPRDRCGSACYFIGLHNASTSFGGRRCEPNFAPTSKLAIGRHIGAAIGYSLTSPSLVGSSPDMVSHLVECPQGAGSAHAWMDSYLDIICGSTPNI
jgi:hypothetical protein